MIRFSSVRQARIGLDAGDDVQISILYFSVFVLSVRYRFSRQPLNRLLWNLAGVFDIVPERQLSILVPNGCIINDLWHKLCIFQGGQSMTSDRYKKPKLRRHNALVSFSFSSDVIRLYLTSNMTGDTDGPKWRVVDGEQRVINSHASTVFNGLHS